MPAVKEEKEEASSLGGLLDVEVSKEEKSSQKAGSPVFDGRHINSGANTKTSTQKPTSRVVSAKKDN